MTGRSTKILICVLTVAIASGVLAQSNRIDIVRHDAPALAHFGKYPIGVRTVELTDPRRPDILNTREGGETVYSDRRLTVEIWYPAALTSNLKSGAKYETTTRNTAVTATLYGRASRDADALTGAGAVPLIIISHGYPGNRYLLSHLGENLASKGYVVASIDHRDSTYDDHQPIASTLFNRPLDQVFVLNQIALMAGDVESFLYGAVDAERTGIVGYSMGGYGLINNLGGGLSDIAVNHEVAPANKLANRHAASNPQYRGNLDARIKAGFAIAPWGMAAGVWNTKDLRGIEVPTFYLAGSIDDTAGYENGTRAIFENATRSDRYLLTFVNAGHNAGAPIPLPREIQNNGDPTGASHYTDPVWDTVRMNNIMDHFATAFFDYYLKRDESRLDYLKLIPNAQEGVFSVEDGRPTAAHSYWHGFAEGTARGLLLERLEPEG